MKLFAFAFVFCLSSLSSFAQLPSVSPGAYHWNDQAVKIGEDRESRKILEGTSPHFEFVKIHATTQYANAAAKPGHATKDIEQLIIVKEGTVKITIEDKSTILGAGGVVLVMPNQVHSLENVGDGILTYYVMQYRSKKTIDLQRGLAEGGSLMLNADSLPFKPSARGGGRAYFDRATAMCERMEMHVTELNKKGPSHAPHSHLETEIILVISGKTEMTIDGREYEAAAGDFYFINSELFHGVRNARDEPCSYFAFKWN